MRVATSTRPRRKTARLTPRTGGMRDVGFSVIRRHACCGHAVAERRQLSTAFMASEVMASEVMETAVPCARVPSSDSRRNLIRSCRRKRPSDQNSIDSGLDAVADPIGLAAAPRRRRIWRHIWRPPLQAQSGFRAAAIAGSPRRRYGSAGAGFENRRPPPPHPLVRPARGCESAGAAISNGKPPPPSYSPQVRRLCRFRCCCKRRSRRGSTPFKSTMRTLGIPSRVGGRQRHGIGITGFAFFRLCEPGRKQCERFVSLGKVTHG